MHESPSGNFGTKFLTVSASLVIVFAGLYAARGLAAPFLLAVFFAMIFAPPLNWLKKKGLSGGIAIAVLSVAVFLIGLGVVLLFTNSLTHFAEKLPEYKGKIAAGYSVIDSEIQTVCKQWNIEETYTLNSMVKVDTLIAFAQNSVNVLLNAATVSALVVIMVVFMLIEAARLPEKINAAFGGRDLSNEYLNKIAADTWNYMKIKTVVSFFTGLATGAGLYFLQVEYAALWGLLMFFLNYIPNIGQIIAAVPPVLLALVDPHLGSPLWDAAWVILWITLVNTAFGYGIEPRYLEQGLGLSGLVVLLSLIFWGWLLGPIGMFLSAPLTMVLKIVLQNDPKTKWMAVMLSNR
ncbi:MAG: AI-2E family transporter [Planctomycetaceae bacterium]|jgi:predicted PurR-regulated permease PerM|nr:AI-2E family transporter [Planctomycetaceae bacterium]